MKEGYRKKENFVMKRKKKRVMRKMKEKEGNYIWKKNEEIGEKD